MREVLPPLVSVVIPNFNQGRYLRRALQSVLDQTYTNWEVIIIDNHSTDNTNEVLGSFIDSRITLLKIHNDGVIAASRNAGIMAAKGMWIAFLDSDDYWYPDKLSICLKRLLSGVDLVCHGLCLFGNRRKRNKFYGPNERASFDSLLYKGNCIATSATVVRREVIIQVGGFNEDQNIITAEDYHLWLKLSKKGVKIEFIDQVLGGYRYHSSNTGRAIKQGLAVKSVVESFFPEKPLRSMRDNIRILLRYGIIDYEIGRSLQANKQFLIASLFFFKSLVKNPLYLKIYFALLLNILFINKY
jgi:glycosyltransferase involved in cell wall biosynthesis